MYGVHHCAVCLAIRHCVVRVYATVQYFLIGESYQMKAAFGQSHPPLYSLGLNETSAFLKQEDGVCNEGCPKKSLENPLGGWEGGMMMIFDPFSSFLLSSLRALVAR